MTNWRKLLTKKIANSKTVFCDEKTQVLTPSGTDTGAMNRLMAKTVISPEFSAATVVVACSKSSTIDQQTLMEQLRAQHAALALDNLVQAQNMLMSQAVALQAIFTTLATQAMTSSIPEQIQNMLGLALRAQSGSRATLQALGELKNPRQATFVRQANFAQGPQQVVNKGIAPARTQEEIAVSTNKLIRGASNELPTNSRAPGQAITGHPGVATLEKVYRTTDRRG